MKISLTLTHQIKGRRHVLALPLRIKYSGSELTIFRLVGTRIGYFLVCSCAAARKPEHVVPKVAWSRNEAKG